MIICSSYCWLGTRPLVKVPCCWDFRIISLMIHFCRPLVLISRSGRLICRGSRWSCRFGIPQGRRDLRLLPVVIIRGLMGLFWCMILPISSHLRISKIGSPKWTNLPTSTWWSCWWVTSAIWRVPEPWPSSKERSLPIRWESSSLRLPLRLPIMSIRPSPLLPRRSRVE